MLVVAVSIESVSMCLLCERTSDWLWHCSHMRWYRGHYMIYFIHYMIYRATQPPVHKRISCTVYPPYMPFLIVSLVRLSRWWGLIPGCFFLSGPFALHPRLYTHPLFSSFYSAYHPPSSPFLSGFFSFGFYRPQRALQINGHESCFESIKMAD